MWAQGVASVSANCSALLVGAVWGCGAALVLGDWRWLLVAVWVWGVALVFAHLPWSLCPVQVLGIGCAPLNVLSASVDTRCSATPCSCVRVRVCARACACVDIRL